MRVTKLAVDAERGYRIDPHDGACDGAHDIYVMASATGMSEHPWHVRVSWASSALLSLAGTEEFAAGLDWALELGQTLKRGEWPDLNPDVPLPMPRDRINLEHGLPS